jgi:hypothetical protein
MKLEAQGTSDKQVQNEIKRIANLQIKITLLRSLQIRNRKVWSTFERALF